MPQRARAQHDPRSRHHRRRIVVDELPGGRRQIMADAGCSVAHAVWVFARRGVVMESFARYRAAGINMSLGTDTNPQSVIEAMRYAAVVSKMMERHTPPSAGRALQAGGDRMWPRMAKGDWAGRGAEELFPQTYAEWGG
jgi:hypothetical protein